MNEINHTEIEDNIKKSVSDAIFAAQRKNPKLTQTEIATAIDVTQAYISDITNGKKTISLKNAVLLADYLGISLDELVKGNHKGNTDTSCAGICQVLVDLFMAGKIRVGETSVDEYRPADVEDSVSWDIPEDWIECNTSYPAIFFSNFTTNPNIYYFEVLAINGILADMKAFQEIRDNYGIEDSVFTSIFNERIKAIRNNPVYDKTNT